MKTLTYWSLPSSRVLHGRRDCPSLTLNAERRSRIREREVPDRWLDPDYGRVSTCARCGNNLRWAMDSEQRRRRDA